MRVLKSTALSALSPRKRSSLACGIHDAAPSFIAKEDDVTCCDATSVSAVVVTSLIAAVARHRKRHAMNSGMLSLCRES